MSSSYSNEFGSSNYSSAFESFDNLDPVGIASKKE